MKRFLLFDSGCAFCTKLAREVEQESNGILMARSLREPDIQAILDEVASGWQWEPMLVEVNEESKNKQVFKGFSMKIRLTKILGVRKAWQISQMVQQNRVTPSQAHQARRQFLKGVGGVVASAAALNVLSKSVMADEATFNQVFLPLVSAGGASTSQVTQKFEILPENEVQKYRQLALKSEQLNAFVVMLGKNYSELALQSDQSRIFVIDDNVIVQFPVSGGAGYSGYEVHISKSTDQITETRSGLSVYDNVQNISTKLFVNDHARLEMLLTKDGQILGGHAFAADGTEISFDELQNQAMASAVNVTWRCVSNCLSSQGLPGWLIGVLAVLCGLACVGTGGAACYACLAAAGYGYYLQMFYCVNACWNAK